MLLRRGPGSGASNFQVLMAQRSSTMKAFSGLFVFPGGVIEPQDGTGRAASKRCGLRELFEEVGVLLTASPSDKCLARAVDLPPQQRHRWMGSVHEDAGKFEELLQSQHVHLPLDALGFVVTFITPKIEQRRFDTDFFVVALERDADVKIDAGETSSFQWISPREAIAANAAGEMKFLPCVRPEPGLGTSPARQN